MSQHEYTPIEGGAESRFIALWHTSKLRVASMASAILILLVVLQQVTYHGDARTGDAQLRGAKSPPAMQVRHEIGERVNGTRHLFNTCVNAIKGSECDTAWPKKRCVVCCTLEAYKGRCKVNSKSNLCAKCCKIMLSSSTCGSFPQRRPCRDCCVKLINSFGCRITGGAKCRRCCDTLRDSRFCRNPRGAFATACERCKS